MVSALGGVRLLQAFVEEVGGAQVAGRATTRVAPMGVVRGCEMVSALVTMTG
jgi:hypothetical protein